jgi:hypothetical protein
MSNYFLFMAIAFAIVGILQLIWMELRRIRRLLERRPGVVAGVGDRPVTPESEPRIGSTERGPDILESGAGEYVVDRDLDSTAFAHRTWKTFPTEKDMQDALDSLPEPPPPLRHWCGACNRWNCNCPAFQTSGIASNAVEKQEER